MWRILAFRVLACCVLAGLSAHVASAQEADPAQAARELFERGLKHVDAEQWADAESAFRAATALRDSPVLRFNLGVTLMELGRWREARQLLKGIAQHNEASFELQAQAEQALRTIAARTATLVVRLEGASDDVAVAVNDETLAADQLDSELLLSPGAHTARLLRAGREIETRELELAAGVHQVIVFTLPVVPPPKRVAESAVAPPVLPAGLSRADAPRSKRARRMWWGLGGSAAAIAAGVIAGVVIASRVRSDATRYEGDFDPPHIGIQVPR